MLQAPRALQAKTYCKRQAMEVMSEFLLYKTVYCAYYEINPRSIAMLNLH